MEPMVNKLFRVPGLMELTSYWVRQTVVTDKEEENVLREDFLPDLSSDTRAFIADAVSHPGGSVSQVWAVVIRRGQLGCRHLPLAVHQTLKQCSHIQKGATSEAGKGEAGCLSSISELLCEIVRAVLLVSWKNSYKDWLVSLCPQCRENVFRPCLVDLIKFPPASLKTVNHSY